MGDLGNRYSTLDQINTAECVAARRRVDVGAADSASEFAIDDGREERHDVLHRPAQRPEDRRQDWPDRLAISTSGGGAARGGSAAGPPSMGSPDREGVAFGDGLVFVGLSDARVIALRDDTGELVWNRYVGEDARDKGQGISGAPVYAGGIVSVGLSADNGWRGQVVGLDGKTGREVWRWFAVPAPGEPGSETWPKTAQWKFGGGALWLAGVADEEAGLVYYVTGNGVPQLSGEHREGDNLFICSIVALDMKTGKLKWHYQTIRHDIWEADMSISPVLYDAQVDGKTVKAIGAIRPDGYVFTFDRVTGKPLMKIEERKVPQDRFQKTAATQPFPAGAEGVLPDCDWWRKTQTIPKGFEVGCYYQAVSTDKPNVLMPYYGMRVAPMSYSQQTGYFYAVGERSLRWLRRAEDGYFFSTAFTNRVPGIDRFESLRDGRHRRPDSQDRLAPGVCTGSGAPERRADDGWRLAVSCRAGRTFQRARRQDRGDRVAVPDGRARRRAGCLLRARWRAVRLARHQHERLGVQARGHAAAATGATAAARAGTLFWTCRRHEADRNRGPAARQRVHRRAFHDRRISVQSLPREGCRRHHGHLAQQRHDGPFGGRRRRLMVHRPDRSGGRRRRDVRSTGHSRLHLQGASLGVRPDHRRIEGRPATSGTIRCSCPGRIRRDEAA